MKFFRNHKKGFTLVELMVSVTIFSVAIVICMGSILSVFSANQKAKTLRSVMDNLNTTLETMTRTIHFGTTYHCGNSGILTTPADCNGSGSSSLTVKAVDGSYVSYSLINGNINRSINFGTNYLLTSPDVVITTLAFRVYGSPPFSTPDLFQPQIIIVINGYVGTKTQTKTTFTLETTVSQRSLDFP